MELRYLKKKVVPNSRYLDDWKYVTTLQYRTIDPDTFIWSEWQDVKTVTE